MLWIPLPLLHLFFEKLEILELDSADLFHELVLTFFGHLENLTGQSLLGFKVIGVSDLEFVSENSVHHHVLLLSLQPLWHRTQNIERFFDKFLNLLQLKFVSQLNFVL